MEFTATIAKTEKDIARFRRINSAPLHMDEELKAILIKERGMNWFDTNYPDQFYDSPDAIMVGEDGRTYAVELVFYGYDFVPICWQEAEPISNGTV